MKVLDRYLLREILPALLLSLGFIILVILVNELFYLAELLLTTDVSLKTVLRILVYLLPSILSLALPLAFIAGVLGGLNRLAGDRETEALRVLGISPARALSPVLILGSLLFLINLTFTFWLTPAANYRWLQTMVNSVLNQATLDLKPGRFAESLPGKVLYIAETNGKNRWQNVFLYQKGENGQVELIAAREARLHLQPERQEAWILMEKGKSYKLRFDRPESMSLIDFEKSQQNINLQVLKQGFSLEKKNREKNIRELWLDRKHFRGQDSYESRLTALELHKRLSLPATCLLFVFLGVALGWKRWPGGRLGGYGLSLLLILVYYFLLITGEQEALRGSLAPWLAMWLPNILILTAGLLSFFGVMKKDRFGVAWQPGRWQKFWRRLTGQFGFSRKRAAAFGKDRFLFPSLVDRYLLYRFFRFLIPAFLALLLVMAAVNFLLRLELIKGEQKALKDLLAYVWFKTPEFALFSLLLSILIAAALSLGILGRRRELLALISSGFSYWRVVRSLIVLGLLLIPLLFFWQDRMMVRGNFRAEQLWAHLSDRPVRTFSYLNRYWLRSGESGRFFHYEILMPENRALYRLLILEPEADLEGFKRILFAREAVIQDSQLLLKEGWERSFSGAEFSLNRFDLMTLELSGTVGHFLQEWKEPYSLRIAELRRYSRELEQSGLPSERFRLEAGFRLAFSLSGLVLILLACAAAGLLGHKGFLWPLAVGLMAAFLYWQGLAIFRSLGLAGLLSAFLAVWSVPIIFLLAGIYLLLRSRT